MRAYRCHACGFRKWSFGALRADQKDLGLPVRPLESRDHQWNRRRVRQVLLSIIIAASIGATTALWLILNPRCSGPPPSGERVSFRATGDSR
jgi:hypothetical protein